MQRTNVWMGIVVFYLCVGGHMSVSLRWEDSTACSALHLESHGTSDSFKTQSSLCLSADQYLVSPEGAVWVCFEKRGWWSDKGREEWWGDKRKGDKVRSRWTGINGRHLEKGVEEWRGTDTEDYPLEPLSVFLFTTHLPSAAAVCTCALPKTSNPHFPKWQSRSGPGCWFSGLIIKDYWHSGEVWLACDRLALILTEGRGMTGIWTPVKAFFCLRAITMWR